MSSNHNITTSNQVNFNNLNQADTGAGNNNAHVTTQGHNANSITPNNNNNISSNVSQLQNDDLTETTLNGLKEEWNNIKMKSLYLTNNEDILKEIFVTVKSGLKNDPLITQKLKIKKSSEENKCQGCNII
jgi:hypothetical protein